MGTPEHFWSPPLGEHILGMCNYRDTIIVATSGGVYVISDKGDALDAHDVYLLRPELRAAANDRLKDVLFAAGPQWGQRSPEDIIAAIEGAGYVLVRKPPDVPPLS